MDFTIKCEPVPNKEDFFDVSLKTYKEKIEGRFEKSELRYLIQQIDNSI